MKKLVILLATVLTLCCLGSAPAGIAFAASETIYTGVLDDLGKDPTFNVTQFPAKANDYSLDVIQVAESSDGELFLYVYQPSGNKLTASEVRISTTVKDNDIAPVDYKLTLLNREGTLAKYKVNTFTVKQDIVRYYYIIQIARPWDKQLDAPTGNDNKVSTVAYPVGKQYKVSTINGEVTYSEAHEDVITITAKYCGYIRNLSGWAGFVTEKTDSHFIAFDTDIPIEKLLEATVTYDSIEYSNTVNWLGGLTVPGTYKEYPSTEVRGKERKLNADREVQTPVIGLFGKQYVWNEIQSVDEFLELEELTDEVREQVEGKKWVLRFVWTEVRHVNTSVGFDEVYAIRIKDASILRLKFITNGKTYDMGVVDNKQTEGDRPSNPNPDDSLDDFLKTFNEITEKIKNGWSWFKTNWWVILALIVGVVLAVIIIVALIRLPFRLIGRGIKEVKK